MYIYIYVYIYMYIYMCVSNRFTKWWIIQTP